MNVAECNKNHSNVIKMPEKKSYTRIPNEVLEKLYAPGFHLSGEQRAVFDFIMRKTLGWGKDSDVISLGQFAEALGIKKPSAIRAIKALVSKKIIIISKTANEDTKTFEINIDTDKWMSLAESLTLAKRLKVVSDIANKPLAKLLPTKEIYKETITKEIKTLSSDFCKSGAEESVQDQISIFENLKNITLEEIEASIPQETKSTPPAEKPKAEKSKKETCLNKTQAEMFADFWGTYPKHRRKEKPKAEKAFKFINPDETLFAEIMAGLGAAINSNDWQKENGQFVCYPERFLKNKKWMDEYDNGKGFRKSGCPMTNYMPPKDLEAEAEKYANLLPEEPGF